MHIYTSDSAVVVSGVVVFAFFHVAARAVNGVLVFVALDVGEAFLLADGAQDVEELADAGAVVWSL